MDNKNKEKCIKFLLINGWTEQTESGGDYQSFYKNGYMGINIDDKEIVFICDEGDVYSMPINYYALLGYLFEYHQIDCGYISV